MAKHKKQDKIIFWIIGVVIAGILLFLLLGWVKQQIFISGSGKATNVGNELSLTQILSINDYRYNETTMIECEIEYEDCLDVCDAGTTTTTFGFKESNDLEMAIEFLTIVPSAYALPYEEDEECYDTCETDYDTCADSARINTTEDYEWDGVEPTDIGDFYRLHYPVFYENSKNACEGFFYMGTWIDEPNHIGCVEYMWGDIFLDGICGSRSITSARNVCETVGGTFTCNELDVSCNI